jgi:hypothetical protein
MEGKMSKQAMGRSGFVGLLTVLASAAAPMGCQGADMPVSARVDPLVATETELAAAIEESVSAELPLEGRIATRMRLAEELIEARAAAEGQLPREGASPAEWAAYYDRYAPLRSSLYDLTVSQERTRRICSNSRPSRRSSVPRRATSVRAASAPGVCWE